MTGFDTDVSAQGSVVRRVLDAYGDVEGSYLRSVASVVAPEAPVIFTGMGSSYSALDIPVRHLLANGRSSFAMEAGELLHYAVDLIPPGAVVVLVSQSGRSAEVLALARRLRRDRTIRTVAVVNDDASPLVGATDVSVPILAGEESTVATKTFLATAAVLAAIADAIVPRGGRLISLAVEERIPDLIDDLARDPMISSGAVDRFDEIDALMVIGRGPALVAADYGALILKEVVGIPAEAMPGGSFRHGPIEVAGPSLGLVILAPLGNTRDLAIRLAREAADLGSPTWLLDGADGREPSTNDRLVVSAVPAVPEDLAPFVLSVPIQHLAAEMARRRGRQPGVMERSRKVTSIE